MGHVFLGRSPGGRLLAIKVVRPELAGDLEFRVRFRREVAAARSVSGLFTAPVVDADTEAPVHKAKASPTARGTKKGSGLRPASLTGTWTGTYVCPRGQTGLRLALRATTSGGLTATFSFYPTAGNVSVPPGSFALTGSYTAKGFQLTPDHWISKPQNYSMVGLTGAASKSDTALSGSIESPACTTFSVSR